jgi:Inositol hexakisphosphate
MKKAFIFFLLTVCVIGAALFIFFQNSPAIYPTYDKEALEAPRNLRTMLSEVGRTRVNLQGLHELKVSGSGQFSEKTFPTVIHFLSIDPEKLIVLDLRQESHGFINGTAISWTDGQYNYANVNKAKSEIEVDENQRLKLALQAKQIQVDPIQKPTLLKVFSATTERDFIERYGSAYVRMPVVDHNRPSNEVLDEFIELIRNLPGDRWIHMHCRAGKGRTTTFLTLFDIAKNAQNVGLQDILDRQKLIGGIDLTNVIKEDPEKNRRAHERLEFIRSFYLYCQQVPDFRIKWSDWVKQ